MNQENRKTGKGSFRSFLLSCFPHSFIFVLFFVSSGACKREERGFRVAPPAADKIQTNSVSDLHPAGAATPAQAKNDYGENAYATAEGQRLFTPFQCLSRHAHRGGGPGPRAWGNKRSHWRGPQR